MKRTFFFALFGVIVITLVIALTFIKVSSVRSGPQASTPTPTYGSGTSQLDSNGANVLPAMPSVGPPKITDLAPDIPYENKPSVIIQHADGSEEQYLLAPGTVNAFLRNLPKGDKLAVKVPPPSLLRNPEAPVSTETT